MKIEGKAVIAVRVLGGIGMITGIGTIMGLFHDIQGNLPDSSQWIEIIALVIWDTICLWALMGPIGPDHRQKILRRRKIDQEKAIKNYQISVAAEQLYELNESLDPSESIDISGLWRVIGKTRLGIEFDGLIEGETLELALAKAKIRRIKVEKIEPWNE